MKNDRELLEAAAAFDPDEWLHQTKMRRAAVEAEIQARDAAVERCITDYVRALDAPLIGALRAAAMAEESPA